MNSPLTFIFIGRSGCGKGTQAELLQKYLNEKTPEAGIFYVETGKRFRDFVQGETVTARRAKEVMNASKRQPDFLAVWNWAHVLVDELATEADEMRHWVLDGTPRSFPEAMVLDTALEFYERKNPFIVHLNVSRNWSEQHLATRGRADDKDAEDIKRRLNWFESDVAPALDWYRRNERYHFLDIQGEQPIEAVHAELVAKIEALG